jgi:hypothetical protein
MSREMLYLAEEMMPMRVAEEHRLADERRLLRLARKSERAVKVRAAARLLYRLGRTLTALGQRLEQHAPSPAQRLPEGPSGVSSSR